MSIAALVVSGLYSRHLTGGLQAADNTAPVVSVGPAAGAIGDTYAQVYAVASDLEEPITIYAVALTDAASAPSSAQVMAGTDASDSAAPFSQSSGVSGYIPTTVTGLTASTAYDIYVVVADALDNATDPVKLDITTEATPTYSNAVVGDIKTGIVKSLVRSIG